MRKLVICLGSVLTLAVFAASSRADMVFEQTYNAPGGGETFNGNAGSPATRTVTFAPELFPASQAILGIDISISFSKLATAGQLPKYNEISFSLSKTEVPSVNLISSGSAAPAYTGSFSPGFNSVPADPGFDGTITFSQSATTAVNNLLTRNKIAEGIYKPATNYDQSAAPNSSLNTFLGVSGSGTYTLRIVDSANTGDPGLVLKSFTVRVTAVPEPTSLACLGLLATAGAFVRRRRRVR